MSNNENSSKVNSKKLHDLMTATTKLINLIYIILIIVGTYAIMLIFKELKVVQILLQVFHILAPLFIGIIFAWLLEPIVLFFTKKGMKRQFSVIISVIIFVSIITIMLWLIIPMISNQFNDLMQMFPAIIKKGQEFIDNLVANNATLASYKDVAYTALDNFSRSITSDFANIGINFVTTFVTSIATFAMGLMMGLYLLFNFNSISDDMISYLPSSFEEDTRSLLTKINSALRDYVQGMFIVVFSLFVVSSIFFWIIGLKAPLLFGMICGITDLIPYIGPYIGGAIAAAVGFTESTEIGLLTVGAIIILQLIESFIFQPVIMSKTMKLHPVTIMIGLLFFGYYFGIGGMVIATPTIAVFKIIFNHFNDKYGFFKKKTRKSIIINEVEE